VVVNKLAFAALIQIKIKFLFRSFNIKDYVILSYKDMRSIMLFITLLLFKNNKISIFVSYNKRNCFTRVSNYFEIQFQKSSNSL
jgi:hypothetical protein